MINLYQSIRQKVELGAEKITGEPSGLEQPTNMAMTHCLQPVWMQQKAALYTGHSW